jgi:hypothetical protein
MEKTLRKTGVEHLVMLGVIHRDPGGAAALRRWLDRIAPEVITLEFTRYGLEFRQRTAESFKKKVRRVAAGLEKSGRPVNPENLFSVISFLDPPYEYTVACEYCHEQGRKLYLVDLDVFSYSNLSGIGEFMEEENIESLLAGREAESRQKELAFARMSLDRGISVFPYTHEMYLRDRAMRDRIAMLMTQRKGKRFLHISGWQHLKDPFSLFACCKPRKAFVYDETFCF